jgi:hypothetical protein
LEASIYQKKSLQSCVMRRMLQFIWHKMKKKSSIF